MAITIEALYEDGVLKPLQPLPLKEHEAHARDGSGDEQLGSGNRRDDSVERRP